MTLIDLDRDIAVERGPSSDPSWHVAWTHSNCEQLVHDHLAAKGFRVFLPKMHVWTRRHGVRQRTKVPAFPGYVFLDHAIGKESYIDITRTSGVVRLLGERWDRLAVVPPAEIDSIRRFVAAEVPLRPYPYLREGQRVRITRGPLTDVEGVLVRTKPNRGLLVVAINILQKSAAVEIDCTAVVPA